MNEGRVPTVVVVNDEPTQLHLTSSILEQDGMHVIRCRGAEEALKILSEHPVVDAIVTDLHMPHIDGWRFCRLLRSPEYPAYNRIPILVVSATFFGTDAEQVTADLGANAFLAIPHEPTALRACMRTLLRGEAPPASLRVLIVEDSKPQATILRAALEARGWTVLLANTVAQARHLYQSFSPEVVVLDYHLPDGTGMELLADVKPPGSATVAVVITADPSPARALECMRSRADGYVRKPFDPEYLISLCDRARRERSFLRVEELLESRTRDLRESESRFRMLLDSIPEVIIVCDEGGKILHISDSGARRLGWSPDELADRPCSMIMNHPVDEATVNGRHPQQACGPVWAEGWLETRSGLRMPVEISRTPILFNGRPATLEVARDVTERKRAEEEKALLEEQLRQSQKMEAIGTLAGGVAHDFNNLLTAILGHAHLMKFSAEQGDAVYQGASVIETAVQRARQLTEQLLGFARRGKYQNVLFDLHGTIRDVFELLSRTVDKKVSFHENFYAERSAIMGDPGQLHQVILNLALNARDAMPDGGQVSCTTRIERGTTAPRRRFAEVSGAEYLHVAIKDTGPGIPKDIQGRIFEPFFTTKEPGKGSGMGLAMVYGIVHNHGGQIEVESEPGKGATFHLYFPLADGMVAPASAKSDPVLERGKGKILVVDDEELVRGVAASMLQYLGYQAVKVQDGIEAVEYYRCHAAEISLVVIDMIMPRMNGRECFRALKQINPNVRAVLSTGYDRNLAVQEILNEGMYGFVQKPYELAQLSRVIAQALRAEDLIRTR